MYRDIGIEVELPKEITVKEIGVKEEIVSVDHQLLDNRLSVTTQIYNSKDEVIKSDYIIIDEDIYHSVFNENGLSLESDDIWKAIDMSRKPS